MSTSIKVIDRHNGQAILKMVRFNGVVIYQTMPEANVGKSAEGSVQHLTLGDARKHIGQPAPKVVNFTPPKSTYPQNGKGYDPHRR